MQPSARSARSPRHPVAKGRAGNGVEAFDVGAFRSGLVAWGNKVTNETFDQIEALEKPTVDNMRKILRNATTPTGERRASKGGQPGRIESGEMLGDISSQVTRTQKTLTLRWGWINHFQPYYAFQEGGSNDFNVRFKGMGALWGSFVNTQDKMFNILKNRR